MKIRLETVEKFKISNSEHRARENTAYSLFGIVLITDDNEHIYIDITLDVN